MSRCVVTTIALLTMGFCSMSISALETSSVDRHQFYTSLTGSYGENWASENNRHQQISKQRIRLGIRYKAIVASHWHLFSDMRLVLLHRSQEIQQHRQDQSEAFFEVRQLYAETSWKAQNELPLGVLFGRKTLRDTRGWWYDNTLDMVQLNYQSTLLSGQISAGGRIVDERVGFIDEPTVGLEDSYFLITHLDYQYYYQHHLEGYLIYQNVDAPSNQTGQPFIAGNSPRTDSNLIWLGFRAQGLWSLNDNPLHYWLDVATVAGSVQRLSLSQQANNTHTVQGSQDIDLLGGIGMDFGFLWKARNDSWGAGLGYARGSGDTSGESQQHGYVQSELANNKGRFFGLNRYWIYGDLLRPELSNLQIFSAFTGWKLAQRLWLETAYHRYHQVEADQLISASRLRITPNGVDKHIGDELNLILGSRRDDGASLQLIASGFQRGKAFNNVLGSRFAYRLSLEFRTYW